MISCDIDTTSTTVRRLINNHVASRIGARDASLYDFSPEAAACAENFMGWVDLASNPPYDPAAVQQLADELIAEGTTVVVFIGQGGSTQAPMTITKYNKVDDSNRVSFRTIDSDSPVRVRELLATIDPHHSVFVLASKSGGTIEPRIMMQAIRHQLKDYMPLEEIPSHLIAITDPGSAVEKQAKAEGWRAILSGEPTVGGRFSALSVFGLFPAAVVGIDLADFLAKAREAEVACQRDSLGNPALALAAFLYDNYLAKRNKVSFLTPKRGRVLGLWIEQLVAESLGKEGKGILPNIEVDALLLAEDPGDRAVIMYETQNDLWDERKNFLLGLEYVNKCIPTLKFKIDSVLDLPQHFIMWEYAIAMCGYLMEVCPFDQPDVQSTKTAVLEMLADGIPAPDFEETFVPRAPMGMAEVRVSDAVKSVMSRETLHDALFALLNSIEYGDYFGLNVFLPYTGELRREALEDIRHGVAKAFGVASCLEVGPRYLHSTGQLYKGGPNQGVFLVLSADELEDILLEEEAPSLGALAKTQAAGDWSALNARGRRAVHVHLPSNIGVALRALAEEVREVLAEIRDVRA